MPTSPSSPVPSNMRLEGSETRTAPSPTGPCVTPLTVPSLSVCMLKSIGPPSVCCEEPTDKVPNVAGVPPTLVNEQPLAANATETGLTELAVKQSLRSPDVNAPVTPERPDNEIVDPVRNPTVSPGPTVSP